MIAGRDRSDVLLGKKKKEEGVRTHYNPGTQWC